MPPDSGPNPERAQLDRRFAGGIAWAGLVRLSSQTLTWAVTLLVARLLTPADYGIVASAAVYLGLVRVVTEFGLGTAIVTQRDLTPLQIAQLGGLAALLGGAAWVGTLALAGPIALMLRVEELRQVVPVLGFATAVSAMNALPTALLQRELEFKRLSQLELLRALVASGSLLLYAWLGLGFWALVLNEVTAVAVFALALYAATRYQIARPRFEDIRASLRLSADLVVARFAWFVYSSADMAIVSRRLGKAVLGDYSMAWTLTSVPTDKISTVIMSVTPGVLARVQRDLPELRRYFLLLLQGLALVLFPATIGIALTADSFIPLLLGEKWRGSIPLVQPLGLLLALRSITPVCGQVLVARLKSGLMARFNVAGAILLPICFAVGTRWGVLGVAVAWLLVSPFFSLYLFSATCREIELPLSRVATTLAGPGACVAVMGAGVLVVRLALAGANLTPALGLALQVATGVLLYTASVALFLRPIVRRVWSLLRTRTIATA